MSKQFTVFSLYDNAIDSLQHGLVHYMAYDEGGEISDIKQGIMNLVNAVDLLVLEKVRQKDEKLIYENDILDKYGISYRLTIKAEKAYKIIKVK